MKAYASQFLSIPRFGTAWVKELLKNPRNASTGVARKLPPVCCQPLVGMFDRPAELLKCTVSVAGAAGWGQKLGVEAAEL